jgi:hypothetical protein
MQYYVWMIVGVMLLAGFLGGAINHFLTQEEDAKPRSMIRSLAVGIGASFMVPLFLNMISSNLIDEIRGTGTNPANPTKLLVLAGFCLVAAVSSRAFIRTLSDRVLAEAKAARKEAKQAKEEVQEVQANIDPILQKETEKELAADQPASLLTGETVSDDERKILEAFARSRYALRTLTGISKDAGYDRVHGNGILSSLEQKGFVGKKVRDNGTRWYIKQGGLDQLARIEHVVVPERG